MSRLGIYLLSLLLPAAGWGACSSPAGVEGQFQYISNDYKVCDGTNWSSMAAAAPSGSCTGAGKIEYASSTLRFCNGTNFVSLDGSQTDGSCAGFTTGTYRYDATNDWMEWCNGTNWKVMKAATTAPTITALSQVGAMDDGGVTTTVTGTNFVSGAVVRIDGVSCTTSTFVSATEMTCVVPGTTGGRIAQVNVTVTNPDSQVGTLTGGFFYIGDPRYWMKADANVSVTSGKVTSWGDSSGNGFNTFSAGSARNPTYTASSASFGNKPVITFTRASTHWMDFGNSVSVMNNIPAVSVVIAASRNVNQPGLMLAYQNNSNNQLRLAMGVGLEWGDVNVGDGGTGNLFFMGRRQEANPLHSIAGGAITLNTPFISSAVVNYNTRAAGLYLNGTLVSSSSTFSTGGGNTDPTNSVNSGIGADDGYDPFGGDIAEILLYSIALNNTQRQALEAYIKRKYNLP